jgi:hypothetical protein
VPEWSTLNALDAVTFLILKKTDKTAERRFYLWLGSSFRRFLLFNGFIFGTVVGMRL